MPVQTVSCICRLPSQTLCLILHSFIPHFHPNAAEQMLGVAGRMTVVYLVDDTLVRDDGRPAHVFPCSCYDKLSTFAADRTAAWGAASPCEVLLQGLVD